MNEGKERDLHQGSIVHNKYIIIKKIDEGGFAKVYLIEEKDTKKQYAIKVLKKGKTPIKEIDSFLREIEILKILTNSDKKINNINNYTPHLYDSGKNFIKSTQNNVEQRYYYVMDYYPKRDLLEYILKTQNGFEEKYAKLIFSKILKGVKFCHDAGICHLDLHLKNIIFDDNYDPKIIDFSFSRELKSADESGMFSNWEWSKIRCPEIAEKKKFNGIKVDIFCLGVILFNLVTKKFGFFPEFNRKENILSYSLIEEKKYDEYWNFINKEIPYLSVCSDNFKNLYISMIGHDASKRPTIDEILKSPWIEEINQLKEEDYHKLEEEVREEFLKLETKMKDDNAIFQIKKIEEKDKDNIIGNKTSTDESKIYFDLNLTPKYIYQEGLNAKNYIIIKGNLNPAQFMNDLLDKIIEEYMEICIIEEEKNKLKCNIIFENQEEDDIDNDEESEYLRKENCVICIKLYEYIDGGYELHFVKKSGELEDYYKYFNKIKEIITQLLD